MAPAELGFRLKCAREKAGLTQSEAAAKSGVGEKTISSVETGARASSLKVAQLEALLEAYGLTPQQFFDPDFEASIIEPPTAAPEAAPMRREREPYDPLARFRYPESNYPTPQSSLGSRACPPPYRRKV